MRKTKKLVALVLIGTTLSLSSGIPVVAVGQETAFTAAETYVQQATAYEYPLTGDAPEWSDLQTREDMLAVCRIPQETLDAMTTEQVVEAALDYPLLINLFAYETPEEGLDALVDESDAFRELMTREERGEKLLDRLQVQQVLDRSQTERSLEQMAIQRLLKTDRIADTYLPLKNTKAARGEEQWSYVTVYTPNGSPVSAIIKGEEYSDAEKAIHNEEMQKMYPLATYMNTATTHYNCHSFAWHNTSTSNIHWINDTSAYRYDGSYTQISWTNAVYKDKVFYGVNNHHSAIVNRLNGPVESTMVISKWAGGPLMAHRLNYSPYNYVPSEVTFWH